MKPAIHIYLFLSTSNKPLPQRHAFHQMNLYVLILEELQDRSWSALLMLSFIRKMLAVSANRKSINDPWYGMRVPELHERPNRDIRAENFLHNSGYKNRPSLDPLQSLDKSLFEPTSTWPEFRLVIR